MTARIPPLPPEENSGCPDNPLFADHTGQPPLNVLTTMARHPKLYRATVPLARCLSTGLLPARDRELVVLRTAARCGSAYEWAHHCLLARSARISEEEIAHLAQNTGTWTPHEQALLAAVDELHDTSTLTEGTWNTLAERYDEAELIELVMLIGEYHKIAFFLNATGTPVDDWIPDTPTGP